METANGFWYFQAGIGILFKTVRTLESATLEQQGKALIINKKSHDFLLKG